MRSRTVRRRKHKELQRLLALHPGQRTVVANQMLSIWQREARRRAHWLGARAVWQLPNDPHIQAAIHALDPTGELLTDLRRVCAEAIAEVADRRMVRRFTPCLDAKH